MTPVSAGVHVRDNRSLTAAVEKRLLIWIAERLPAGIGSDHLSAIGLAAMFVAAGSFAAMAWWPVAATAVVLALAVNWFGDSLDGTVARVRGQQRPRYGYYLDHVIDISGTTALLVGLASSGLMHPTLALAVLAAYLMVSAESFLAAHASGRFRMSFLGFGPTELRIVLAAGAIKAAFAPMVVFAGAPMRLFDIGGFVAAAGLTIAFLVAAGRNTRMLYREEPVPAARESRAA